METQNAQPSRRPIQWGLVALLALIGIATLFSLAMAAYNLSQGMILWIQGDAEGATYLLTVVAGSLARVLLLLPAAYYALVALTGRAGRHLPTEALPNWLLLAAWAAILALGGLVVTSEVAAPLLLPPLSAAAILIPLWLVARLALRGLDGGSDLRRWGSLGLGTTAGPLLSTIIEAGFLFVLAMTAVVIVVANPSMRSAILDLAARLDSAQTEQAIGRILMPLLLDRRVAFVAILTLCVVTPLVEEAIKPIAVWMGAGRISSAAQGFALGALCGCGFAAFESLMAVAAGGPEWWQFVLMRTGTGVMHAANAGLMGWALVAAWRERRFLRLALVYGAVIAVHGTWNLLALAYGLSSLPVALEGMALNLSFEAAYALPGLAILAVLMLAVLISMNRSLSGRAGPGSSKLAAGSPGRDLQV